MFKFAKLSNVKAAVVTTAKSQSQLVEELHNEFDTATDRIVENANAILAKAANERAKRLRKLGFGSNKEVVEDNRLQSSKEDSAILAGLVERYKERYPAYKFITHEEVIRIAEKYGLVLGEASDFIGNIPEENLVEIENAKISEEDHALRIRFTWSGEIVYAPLSSAIAQRDNNARDDDSRSHRKSVHFLVPDDLYYSRDSTLKVVAPLKDFNTVGKVVRNNQLVKEDPIVLHPVIGGYLILTAWGLEANDPMVKR